MKSTLKNHKLSDDQDVAMPILHGTSQMTKQDYEEVRQFIRAYKKRHGKKTRLQKTS